MKITLFNVNGRLSNDGSRLISAILKKAGHSVKMVFLTKVPHQVYEPHEIEYLQEILRDTELVMISVYSTFFIRAVRITEFVRRRYPGLKVIWGGALYRST